MDTITQLQTIQSNLGSFDMTTLSVNGQASVLMQLGSVLTTIIKDVLSNVPDSSKLFTAMADMPKNDHTPPTQANP